MAIAEQFAGLPMDSLIGAPLSAAANASTQLATSTADFINRVGFDETGKVRTVAFAYQKRSVNEDGTSNLDEMKVDIPMLAIVPIPNLQVDEVNILFDMEVKQSERQESSMDLGAAITGTAGFGPVKVSVSGSISAHQSNTRSSDNSAKYHVDVRAANHGTPEGLARVLDMMAANVAPSLVGSTLKDSNGQNLPEQARIRAERLKGLRREIGQIETRLGAARNGLDNQLQRLKAVASQQVNVYQGSMMKLLNGLDQSKEEDNVKAEACSQAMNAVSQNWNSFISQAADMVKLVADSGGTEEGVSELFGLKALDPTGEIKRYENGESCYSSLAEVQKSAATAQVSVESIKKELFAKKAEYSEVSAGKAVPMEQS